MNFWNYNSQFSPPVANGFQLGPETNMTPVYTLGELVSNPALRAPERIWIKDERAHPTGTHKDRSFRYWISRLYENGIKEAVISSSGNSAFAAAFYCSLAQIRLQVFVRHDFPNDAAAKLAQYPLVILHQSKTPKKDAFLFGKKHAIPYLRASIDPLALEGYKTLSFELAKAYPDIEEIFIPTSSAATLVGVYNGYRMLGKNN